MHILPITIKNKAAEYTGTDELVCYNSDYRIKFSFDADFAAYDAKTVRFWYYDTAGDKQTIDVLFTGDEVDVPVIPAAMVLYVGVYAGNIRTSTDAEIPCRYSILSPDGAELEPNPDVYHQLLEAVETQLPGALSAAGRAEKAADEAEEIVDTAKDILQAAGDGIATIQGYVSEANTAANTAVDAKTAAEAARDLAKQYADDANTAKTAAETAETNAEASKTAAQGYAEAAETSANRADTTSTNLRKYGNELAAAMKSQYDVVVDKAVETKESARQASNSAQAAKDARDIANTFSADAKSAATRSANAADRAENYAIHQPTIGENKNWYVWNGTEYTDTGYLSHGEAGIAPHIGDNGNWYIGDTDTGVYANYMDNVMSWAKCEPFDKNNLIYNAPEYFVVVDDTNYYRYRDNSKNFEYNIPNPQVGVVHFTTAVLRENGTTNNVKIKFVYDDGTNNGYFITPDNVPVTLNSAVGKKVTKITGDWNSETIVLINLDVTKITAEYEFPVSDVVEYKPQTLTSEQQKQARRNIDANKQVYAVTTGNPWSADDCIDAPVRDIKLYGASEQTQYRGVNLLKLSGRTTTRISASPDKIIEINDNMIISGISSSGYLASNTTVIDEIIDNSITFHTTTAPNSAGYGIGIVLPYINEQLVINAKHSDNCTLHICYYDGQNKYISYHTISNGVAFTPNAEGAVLMVLLISAGAVNVSRTVTDIQIEKGSTATAYEPYVGGIPSPNPYYPQEVRCNDLTYNLTGKNLFNPAWLPSSGWDKVFYKYLPIYIGVKKTVTVSYKSNLDSGLNFYITVSNDDSKKGTSDGRWLYHSDNSAINNKSITVTSSSTGYIYLNIAGDCANADQYIFTDGFQIEIGSTATDYEPYHNGGSVTAPELYAIGDVRDEWDAVTGKGIRRIKKLVLDGTESWRIYVGTYSGFHTNILPKSLNRANGLCNQLTVDTIGEKTINGLWIGANDTYIYAINSTYYDETLSDKGLSKWKAHINEHPLEVYYPLTTPELFEIEPAPQITTPDGYAHMLPSGDGVAGDVELEYAIDVEKRYVPKTQYIQLEERVAALEANAIGG